ncbi:EndoU domain-containing protein [bacterium]|nr:EndoU domain-containing protein [bacterium]
MAVGFHHRGSIGHIRHARITKITKPPKAQRVYEAEVEIYDPNSGRWISNQTPSTFFPDSWSRAQVLNEIRGAFQNRTFIWGNRWEGISPSGVIMRGFLDSAGNLQTAYPVY